MPDGHFHIGDLSFSYDGDLAELAEIQSLMREMRSAEGRLKAASGADSVVLIYDQDLEGEQGTFDRMRLRAHTSAKSYTLDIGNTDNNPLGIYVGYAQPIRVYDRKSERAFYLDDDGNEYKHEEKAEAVIKGEAGSTSTAGGSSSQQEDSSSQGGGSSSGGDGGGKDLMGGAEALIQKFSDASDDTPATNIKVGGTPLPSRVGQFRQWAGRSENYISRVEEVKGGPVQNLTAKEAADAIRMIADEQRLQDAETVQDGQDDLPF